MLRLADVKKAADLLEKLIGRRFGSTARPREVQRKAAKIGLERQSLKQSVA